MIIPVTARKSRLSQIQVGEVFLELQRFFPLIEFQTLFLETIGDKDQKTSLREMEKTDFFTKEIDEFVLQGHARVAVHSAKDLPEPLPTGLDVIALTAGVDPADVLVMREGMTVQSLKQNAVIGTSTIRREAAILQIRPDFVIKDLRGNIQKRLELLKQGVFDGIVMAEAALLRLGLHHINRCRLPGEVAPLQGKLAVLARSNDEEMRQIFSKIHVDLSQPV
jgi:hydroxymethylbilane synthase